MLWLCYEQYLYVFNILNIQTNETFFKITFVNVNV
jgi:hypothetical protein